MTTALKVGLMVPMNNTTMEPEMLAWLPAGSTCTTLRIPRGKGLLTAESIPEYKAQALFLARQFAAMDLDVVAYGCTAASFISGPEGDAQLARELAEITGKPVVTTAQSMVIALREDNAKDIALVTPYTDLVNRQLKAYLANSGIRVQRFNSFYAADVEELGRIQADAVARLAGETMDDECEAMFIACSQLPTYEILDGLRNRFGRPVWSSVQATARQATRAGRLQTA
ncbi:MAG: aspartate/glutamate racemase family protein [Betaproteobacteria bacterium]|nr:aspartate/glutamate racemase family protein [Betaproteobacteria bacterium]MDH3435395.1 aspartate/glutamate racemase family protein [Betaproteobacteria bacterium]